MIPIHSVLSESLIDDLKTAHVEKLLSNVPVSAPLFHRPVPSVETLRNSCIISP